MISIRVKPFAMLRDFLKTKEFTVELHGNPIVKNLLEELFRRFGEKLREKIMDPVSNQVKHHWVILVNGNNIKALQTLDTPLKDGDEVIIFPPVAGG